MSVDDTREAVARRRECRHENAKMTVELAGCRSYSFADGELHETGRTVLERTGRVRVSCADCGLNRLVASPGAYPNWLCGYLEKLREDGTRLADGGNPEGEGLEELRQNYGSAVSEGMGGGR